MISKTPETKTVNEKIFFFVAIFLSAFSIFMVAISHQQLNQLNKMKTEKAATDKKVIMLEFQLDSLKALKPDMAPPYSSHFDDAF